MEFRWAEGHYERLPVLAAELVRLRVDLLVTSATPATLAAKQATTTIPIVMTVVGDAVGSGLVASLARPGGNVSGITFSLPELGAKRLELLREAIPRITQVAVFVNPDNSHSFAPILSEMEMAATPLRLTLRQFPVREPREFHAAFASMARIPVDALALVDDTLIITNAKVIAEGAAKQRLPSIGSTEFAAAGGLLAYE
jgi:putative ABC transport system substrate-binding protein